MTSFFEKLYRYHCKAIAYKFKMKLELYQIFLCDTSYCKVEVITSFMVNGFIVHLHHFSKSKLTFFSYN